MVFSVNDFDGYDDGPKILRFDPPVKWGAILEQFGKLHCGSAHKIDPVCNVYSLWVAPNAWGVDYLRVEYGSKGNFAYERFSQHVP